MVGLAGGCAQLIKAGAAAEHFAEGLAEVAEAGIADLQGGFTGSLIVRIASGVRRGSEL